MVDEHSAYFAARGVQHFTWWFGPGMALVLSALPAAIVLDWCASTGLDLPYRYYLGYLEDRPVAASTLSLGAGVAGVYNVATLPGLRHGSLLSRLMRA